MKQSFDLLRLGGVLMKQQRPKELELYYYDYPNVGDSMNKVLFEKLFGMLVSHQKTFAADMVAIGSILNHFLVAGALESVQVSKNPVHVWGTGLMFAGVGTDHKPIRPLEIHALRGELTRQAMSLCLGEDVCCPLADPGLLASLLVPAQKKKYDIGLIPHYVDAREECFREMKEYYPNSVLINVQDDPISVIEAIGQCKTILSTSLHGLVLADSFGIPNRWCVCSDRILGKGHKFRDYYSSYGLEAEPYDLNNGSFPRLEEIQSEYAVPYYMVCKKQYQLLRCVPCGDVSALKALCFYLKSIWRGTMKTH